MQNIISLTNKKTFTEALIFYVLLATVIILSLYIIVDVALSTIPLNFRTVIGQITAGVVPFLISIAILNSRKEGNKTPFIFIAFLSLTGYLFGIFIALLPTVYLSTMDTK